MIELPWPSSMLAGHHKTHFWRMRPIIAQHREWARLGCLAANLNPVADTGDIRIIVTFYPGNNRGDRVNYPNLMKPYWDGIADALGVNDKRFLPSYQFGEQVKGGKVVVTLP